MCRSGVRGHEAPSRQSAPISAWQENQPINNSLREALPFPLMLGMILNSMPIASLRGILNSSRSLDVPGGLKLNCWRTISRHSALPEAHHEMVNSCVRAESFSSNKTDNFGNALGGIESHSDCLRAVRSGAPAFTAFLQRVIDRVGRVFRGDLKARQAPDIQPFTLPSGRLLKDLFSYHVTMGSGSRCSLSIRSCFLSNACKTRSFGYGVLTPIDRTRASPAETKTAYWPFLMGAFGIFDSSPGWCGPGRLALFFR